MSGAKGQLEYMAIVAVALIAVFASVYAFSSGMLSPQALFGNDEYKSAHDSVSSYISAGAYEAAKLIAANGGHAEPTDTVRFLGTDISRGVPGNIADVNSAFASVLDRYITNGKSYLERSLANSNVKLEAHSVSVSVMENKVVVRVDMPITVKNQTYTDGFSIEIPSKLGQMYAFAKDFSAANARQGFFEHYTMAAIASSPVESDISRLPLFIFLTDCGARYEKSWSELRADMDALVKGTVTHTYYGKIPNGTEGSRYLIPGLGGAKYIGLQASFALPDSFGLDAASFAVSPSPVVAEATDVNGFCFSNPVRISYSVKYPVVAAVSDGNLAWLFAFDVSLNSGVVGATNETGNVCSSMKCAATVSVKDATNAPLEGAKVLFMGCAIGTTESSGSLRALAPCGDGMLDVRKDGYATYSANADVSVLERLEVTLNKTIAVELKLHEVPVKKTAGKYVVQKGAPLPNAKTMDLFFMGSAEVRRTFGGASGAATLPEGKYSISAQLSDSGTPVGGFIARFYAIGEGTKTLYVYVPSLEGFGKLGANDRIKELAGLTKAMEQCMATVSDHAITLDKDCEVDANG